MDNRKKIAVVTGGHSYDVIGFQQLFRKMPELDSYIQHMDDFCSSPEEVRDLYDAVVFYIMMTEEPTDEDLPWYQGKPKTALEHLGKTGQGIVVLHHALLAYPAWPVWGDICGLKNRSFRYFHDQQVATQVMRRDHPIVKCIDDFVIDDETYMTDEPDPDNEILLTTLHPKSTEALAWTRLYGTARVFCYQGGHDRLAWENPQFIQLLKQGIIWTTGNMEL